MRLTQPMSMKVLYTTNAEYRLYHVQGETNNMGDCLRFTIVISETNVIGDCSWWVGCSDINSDYLGVYIPSVWDLRMVRTGKASSTAKQLSVQRILTKLKTNDKNFIETHAKALHLVRHGTVLFR